MSNIKPVYWGSNYWKTMFSFAAVYPNNPDDEYINSIKYFFTSLKKLIPCTSCLESYNKYILEDDTNINDINNFNSKKNLILFIFNLKNKINKKINIDYGITLNYLNIKINNMICHNDNNIDHIINNLNEAPILNDSVEKLVLNYLQTKNFNIKFIIKLKKTIKCFIDNPIFDKSNKYFIIFCKRNKKCRDIICKIQTNMYTHNYDLITSFKIDNNLHNQLFNLYSTIIPYDILTKILSN